MSKISLPFNATQSILSLQYLNSRTLEPARLFHLVLFYRKVSTKNDTKSRQVKCTCIAQYLHRFHNVMGKGQRAKSMKSIHAKKVHGMHDGLYFENFVMFEVKIKFIFMLCVSWTEKISLSLKLYIRWPVFHWFKLHYEWVIYWCMIISKMIKV